MVTFAVPDRLIARTEFDLRCHVVRYLGRVSKLPIDRCSRSRLDVTALPPARPPEAEAFMHSRTTGWTLALFGMILLGYLVAVAWAVPYITGGEMYYFVKYPDKYGEVSASVARHEGYRFAADAGESMFREPAYILA